MTLSVPVLTNIFLRLLNLVKREHVLVVPLHSYTHLHLLHVPENVALVLHEIQAS